MKGWSEFAALLTNTGSEHQRENEGEGASSSFEETPDNYAANEER